jgi:hypothetical protein
MPDDQKQEKKGKKVTKPRIYIDLQNLYKAPYHQILKSLNSLPQITYKKNQLDH